MNSKVSIIIPIFNRGSLISETIESILAQTYNYWECFIIDDGSTDDTMEVVSVFAKADARIKLLERPKNKSKGANACRNTGLEKATGDYIVFFDSDDLMTTDHLEVKIKAIQNSNYDYIITKTAFFNAPERSLDHYYQFDKFNITPFNYISQKINWLTYDTIIKSKMARSVLFNEKLQSGQEYNYYSKLVFKTTNARFENKVVTLRRQHDNSIRSSLNSDLSLFTSKFYASYLTAVDIYQTKDYKSINYLLNNCIDIIYNSKASIKFNEIDFLIFNLKFSIPKTLYYVFMRFSLYTFKKGYYFKKRFQSI